MGGHETVGIEHDHMLVGRSPARDEIRDIASLAARVLRAVAIVETRLRSEAFAHGNKGAFLGDPDIRIGRVRQEEPVVMIAEARRLDLLEDRLHGAEHACGRLVVDRHDDGGPRLQRPGQFARQPVAGEQPDEAQQAAREGKRDPREIRHEQKQQRPFQRGDDADVDDAVHFPGAIGGQQGATAKHEQARSPGRVPELARQGLAFLLRLKTPQRLNGHGKRRFRRHAGVTRDGRALVPARGDVRMFVSVCQGVHR